jgi:hypothetical protein
VAYPVGTGAEGEERVAALEDAVVDAEESSKGVEVAGVVDASVDIADCTTVKVGTVVEVDSDDVVDGVTMGIVEEAVEEDCVRSVCVEKDGMLDVDPDVVEETVTSEDVIDEDESAVWAEEK